MKTGIAVAEIDRAALKRGHHRSSDDTANTSIGRIAKRVLATVGCLAALLTVTSPVSGAERQVLQGHVPEAVTRLGLQPLGRLPATNRLNLAIGLPLHHTNALAQLLRDVYDPANPQFRRYLSPEEFTDRFGPTKGEYAAVREFVEKNGLQVTGTSSNRVVLDVAGQVADIERTFEVKLITYEHPREKRQFYAPDVEPSVEAGLPVQDINGLSDLERPRPAFHDSKPPWATQPGTGSGPNGTFMGRDLRNAYAPGVTLDGTGQMVGLVAFAPFYAADIAAYENMAELPNVPIQTIFLGGYNGSPIGVDPGDIGEANLDIQMVISMAPGLSKVVVFDAGPNGNPTDVLSAMAQNPQTKQFSSSWIGWSQSATIDSIFQQMALQGQSFFECSGDGNSWVTMFPFDFWPADDPYLTSVGGTSLTMNGSGSAYASETVWNQGFTPPGWYGSGYVGTGGGTSPRYGLPSWQGGLDMSANRGSTIRRNFPDVAMAADNFVIVLQGARVTGASGTSFAAPLWAGLTALINQEAEAHAERPVGFLNPALYALGRSAAYTNAFRDTTVGNNATTRSAGLFPAVPGFDLCTGWGSPNGSNFIHALALPERLVIGPSSELLFSGAAGGPFSPGSVTYSVTNRNGLLGWSLTPDVDWLSASPITGTLVAGGSNAVITVTPNLLASNLSAGTYNSTLLFSNLADQSVQRRHVTLAVMAPPLITVQPTNQAVLQGMATTFHVGTAANALLEYQWQLDAGGGPTNLTDNNGISGSRTSSLTVANVSPANEGAYSVMVSNSAGSVTSASATLTLITGQPPLIVSQPASQTVLPGATATFAVRAVGDPPLAYTWLLNGTPLPNGGNVSGTTSSTLSIRGTTAGNSGDYSVLLTNGFGSVTSAVGVLSVPGVSTAGVALETVYSLTNNLYGCLPFGGLVQARDGNFYGTAAGGGAYGYGTVFRLATNGTIGVVHAFNNDSYGMSPYARLIEGTNGLLYGTTTGAGSTGDGTLFRVATNGALTAYSFNGASSGAFVIGALVQGRDGNFYGTAAGGGAYSYGTVFRLTPGGVLTALGSFNSEDGLSPTSTLLQGTDGDLYGTSRLGGTNGGGGTIFKISPSGTFTTLFAFNKTNGADAIAGLTLDPDGNLYGTTYAGGVYDHGTVFKLSVDGTFTSLHSFSGSDGSECFAGLLLASDGNFYGTAENGGDYGQGTVFRMSPDGAVTTLAHFDGYQGASPEGKLVEGTDGKLYGTTLYGGAAGFGAIYRLSLDGALQITSQPQPQIAFTGETVHFSVATFGGLPVSYQWLKGGTNLVDGANVAGANARVLTLTDVDVPDAAIYSVVVSNAYGSVASAEARLEVIFSPPYILSGPVDQTVLSGTTVSFHVEAGGDAPLSFQWQKDGGTNLVDGGNISGSTTATLTLRAATAADMGTYSVVVSNEIAAVSSPGAELAVLPGISPSGNLVSLRLFSGSPGLGSAFNPCAGVIQGADGYLYGTTLNGGTALFGTVFRLSVGGAFSVLHSFTNGLDGAYPRAGLVQAGAGTLYGASQGGMWSQYGALFKIMYNGVFTTLYAFTGGDDGANPLAALVVGNDGTLYGTASTGGTNDAGSVFAVTANGVFGRLWSFNSGDGSYPAGALVQGSAGVFYGTTSAGGANGLGTVFSLTTNGSLTSLVSLDYSVGVYPSNGLIQASAGAIYGTASHGGTNGGFGTVFRLNPDHTLTGLHSFNWWDGACPVGGLLEGTDGNLYGTTSQGGIGGEGTLFQITPQGVLTTLVWFNGANGANPQAALIQARDGYFYGTTEFGGTGYSGASESGNGLVFRLMLPLFRSQVIAPGFATVGVPYAGSLSTNAVGPPGASLAFAKVSGPAWLAVAASGALSGTPGLEDIGTNLFTVSLADTKGWISTATLRVAVVPAPLVASLVLSQGTNLVLSWTGGRPPYQVEMTTELEPPLWQPIGGPLSATTLLLAPTNAAGFYRVVAPSAR